ncbi:MAG: FAD-dependent oxidoreductase [Desulfobacteraceae bacterium]|nr:FAD-dependent oxidoreductase [Desulfobacteraceae bacterium]
MNRNQVDRRASILIIGAGPAGLSTAYYLKSHGFKNVTVMERLGRVGGLCCSATEDYQSFELGAVIVPPSYRELHKIAKKVGMKLTAVWGATAMSLSSKDCGDVYHDLFTYLAGGATLRAKMRFLLRGARYLWKRWRLHHVIDRPGWKGIAAHRELCVPFSQWLGENGLEALTRLFEIPLTTFGYGKINEIAAPYVLRYLSPMTVIAGIVSSQKIARFFPSFLLLKNFEFGFQRFWERVSWELNVRLNCKVKRIERNEKGITVTYSYPAQLINKQVIHDNVEVQYDYLILASPFLSEEFKEFMDLTEEEENLAAKLKFNPYAVTTFEIEGEPLKERVVLVLPPPPVGQPLAILQQHIDNELMIFYAYLPTKDPTPEDEARLKEQIAKYVQALGGRIRYEDDWHSYDVWHYFRHVDPEDFRDGYYDRWESIQGKNRTYFVGGLFDFDYIEGIVQYSKDLVERNFVGKKITISSP